MNEISPDYVAGRFKQLQDDICMQLTVHDKGGNFREDVWTREEGGGGRTRVIEGRTIEKGGVAFSAVSGPLPAMQAKQMRLEPCDFFATGVSVVLHPVNPMQPIIHMNVRFFETSTGQWWFGGGIDLTPHYINRREAGFFHHQLKLVCDQLDIGAYARFKTQADDYFFIKHRNETRGVGGIFYDYLNEKEGYHREQLLDFSLSVGNTFAPLYGKLLQNGADRPWGDKEKAWQQIRRGRYVEFNLVWDRGTRFGLETNGRTESILMSMPPSANWWYNTMPEPHTPEAETLSLLKKNIDWVSFFQDSDQ
jgi:coproporphyrinogen III oxidase